MKISKTEYPEYADFKCPSCGTLLEDMDESRSECFAAFDWKGEEKCPSCGVALKIKRDLPAPVYTVTQA